MCYNNILFFFYIFVLIFHIISNVRSVFYCIVDFYIVICDFYIGSDAGARLIIISSKCVWPRIVCIRTGIILKL